VLSLINFHLHSTSCSQISVETRSCYILPVHHSSAVFRRGSHCSYQYTSRRGGAKTLWAQINNSLWLRSTADQRTSPHFFVIGIGRPVVNGQYVHLRIEQSDSILYNIKCVACRAKSCYLMLFSVNQLLRIVKIDSFREFYFVWWLRMFSSSRLHFTSCLNVQEMSFD
jgi:hypothetical protein